MGSVIDYIKCPRCSGAMCVEFNYRTQEVWEACQRCGRRGGWHYLRDESYAVIKDEHGEFKKEFDNVPGYGTAFFQCKHGVGVGYALEHPADEELKAAFFEEIKREDIDEEKSYLTVWDEETNSLVLLHGTMPPSYDEMFSEEETEEEVTDT